MDATQVGGSIGTFGAVTGVDDGPVRPTRRAAVVRRVRQVDTGVHIAAERVEAWIARGIRRFVFVTEIAQVHRFRSETSGKLRSASYADAIYED